MSENKYTPILKTTAKQITDPSGIWTYVSDNYLEGLQMYQLLKEQNLKDLRVVITYTDNTLNFSVEKKGELNDQDSK